MSARLPYSRLVGRLTEIISQVTRGTLSDRLPVIAVREQMQQARCSHCEVPLDGREHKDGCHYTFFRAGLQQNQPPAYNPADLCNANPCREIIPTGATIPRNDEEVRREALAECAYADNYIQSTIGAYCAAMAEIGPAPERTLFPQEIEEPRPQPWWKRIFGA